MPTRGGSIPANAWGIVLPPLYRRGGVGSEGSKMFHVLRTGLLAALLACGGAFRVGGAIVAYLDGTNTISMTSLGGSLDCGGVGTAARRAGDPAASDRAGEPRQRRGTCGVGCCPGKTNSAVCQDSAGTLEPAGTGCRRASLPWEGVGGPAVSSVAPIVGISVEGERRKATQGDTPTPGSGVPGAAQYALLIGLGLMGVALARRQRQS